MPIHLLIGSTMTRSSNRGSGPGLLTLSCLGCVGVVLLGGAGLVVLGGLAALVGHRDQKAEPNGEPVVQGSEAPKKVVTKSELEQLIDAHRADEAGARRKYDGTSLTVTGVVKSTDRHVRTEQGGFVMLGQVEGVSSVAANFKPANVEQALALPVGERVTIRGKYGNGAMLKDAFTLILTHCEIVPAP